MAETRALARARARWSRRSSNAIKYSDAGGHVRLELRTRDGQAELSIADTGMGIEAEHLDKIWQRLYRAEPSRSRPGLGLGLSFVKAVVEAHGGHVLATSTPGRGSEFVVRLPLS